MNRYLLGLLLTLWAGTAALAIDDLKTFELDGDAVKNGPVLEEDDWDLLYGGGGNMTAYTFVEDFAAPDTIYTGGGSKTPNFIADYKWKGSPPPPDKTNVTNAYAANYIVKGEQVVYFGADLYADNGDAELAFWFLQDEVGLNPDGTFYGEHVLGDTYVAAKFSNGGTDSEIAVYAWDESCAKDDRTPDVPGSCAAANLRIVVPFGPASCGGKGGIACAITNLVDAVSPWPYTPKSGDPNVFPPTTFFEGGINIFNAFGQNLCFSSFMVQSGASTSFTSTAKDFALGEFNVCSVDVTKSCVNDDESDDTPAAITYQIRGCAINDGGGLVTIDELLDNQAGMGIYDPSATWYEPLFDTDCSDPDSLKAAVDAGVPATDLDIGAGEVLVYEFSTTTAINGVSDEVTLNAVFGGSTPVDPAYATATCPIRTFNADLSVTKGCEVKVVQGGLGLSVKVEFSGQVCNSSGEVDLTNLMLSDILADGTPVFGSYATTVPAGGCIPYTGYYYPQSLPSGDLCPLADQVMATVDIPANTTGVGCDGSTCSAMSNSATCVLRAGDGDGDCSTGVVNP